MKKSIRVILAGLLIVPVMALGISLVSPSVQYVSAQSSIKDGASAAKGTDTPDTLFGGDGSVFNNIANAALYVIGAISVLMLIYGGIRYTISGGDTGAVTKAKDTILYAVIGIVVALMAYAIVNFVLGQLIPS
ncbi:MAG: pilin [Candidatus Saccharibacteria bacterium]